MIVYAYIDEYLGVDLGIKDRWHFDLYAINPLGQVPALAPAGA